MWHFFGQTSSSYWGIEGHIKFQSSFDHFSVNSLWNVFDFRHRYPTRSIDTRGCRGLYPHKLAWLESLRGGCSCYIRRFWLYNLPQGGVKHYQNLFISVTKIYVNNHWWQITLSVCGSHGFGVHQMDHVLSSFPYTVQAITSTEGYKPLVATAVLGQRGNLNWRCFLVAIKRITNHKWTWMFHFFLLSKSVKCSPKVPIWSRVEAV